MSKVHTLGRRLVAQNSKWRVYLDHVADDRGNSVPDYLAIEPVVATAQDITGICVLPVLTDGRVLLIDNFRHLFKRHSWEVVRGFVDEGETEAAAALRELTEEANVSTVASCLQELGAYTPEPSTILARGAIFVAWNCTPGGSPDDGELGLGDARAFTRPEIEDLIERAAIEDAGTLITLLLWLRARPRGDDAGH